MLNNAQQSTGSRGVVLYVWKVEDWNSAFLATKLTVAIIRLNAYLIAWCIRAP